MHPQMNMSGPLPRLIGPVIKSTNQSTNLAVPEILGQLEPMCSYIYLILWAGRVYTSAAGFIFH